MARTRGFTLIEVLLATALLAAGLALSFATLRAATATVERGEALARDSERTRAVGSFLRRRLASAQPVAFGEDGQGSLLRFVGEVDRMQFVSDTPAYLGRGGPALHDIRVVRGDDGLRLEVSLATVLAGQTWRDDPPRPPELLADGLGEVRLSYRGVDPQGALTGWLQRWPEPGQMPLQVRVELVDGRGRAWPTLVVALVQSDGHISGPFRGDSP